MNVIVNFEGRPATAAMYQAGVVDAEGIERVTDAEIAALVRRAVRDIDPKTPCRGNVMVGRECHRLDAPYIFRLARGGAVVDFKRRRRK